MEKRIKSIISKVIWDTKKVKVEVLTTSKLHDDLGLESLDAVLLIYSIEEEFLIQIPDRFNNLNYVTVQDIIDVVSKVKKEMYGPDA